MLSSTLILTLISLFSASSATIYVTHPVVGTSFGAGTPYNITWSNDASAPLGTAFGSTDIALFAGSLTQQTQIQALGNVADPTTITSLLATITPSVGPNDTGYFLRFQSVAATTAAGVPLQAFSARFTLTGMTGQFSAAVLAQISAASAVAAATASTIKVTAAATTAVPVSTVAPKTTSVTSVASVTASAAATTTTVHSGGYVTEVKLASAALVVFATFFIVLV